MKRYILVLTFLYIILLPPISWSADKIEGNACFTYGDNESLIQAERTAKMLALRNAIESYSVFIESKSQIKNYEVISDIIESVSAEQVQNIKVLKRTKSGRKICYAVQGYVNPERMKKAIKNYSSDISTDVQLQNNGYLRIIDQPRHLRMCATSIKFEILTEFNDEKLNDLEREKYGFKKYECSRVLAVDFQFLKHCIATTIPSGNPAGLFGDIASSNYEAFIPRFRCDYRFKVFMTSFSAEGDEIETEGKYPTAYFTHSTDKERKIEMFPGEKTFITFSIDSPEGRAKSWKVWVPK